MRKQTKLVAVLSAAALLALGASMTSFAAGWEKDEAGVWHYYDSADEMVTDEWKKDGGKWFYLNEDGDMLTDAWVDDDYYVGEDGAMLVNQWIKSYGDNDFDDPEDDEESWYYFDSKGKKVTDDMKKINGKHYFFDTDGKMKDGWYQDDKDNVYYLGDEDDGARKSGWLWLEVPEEDDVDVNGHVDEKDKCDDEGWYYFGSDGKMYKDATAKKKVNGKYYYFNDHGQMLYEWINTKGGNELDGSATPAGSATIGEMIYANQVEEGWRADGWYEIAGSEDVGTEDDTDWYYFKKGEAKKATDADEVTGTDNKTYFRVKEKINGKYFCFDENGAMQTGLQKINGSFYYFDEDGYMKTGKITADDADDDTYNFYFSKKNHDLGKGVDGVKDGYLYKNGQRLEADDETAIYNFNGKLYLVNTKGKVQKTTSKWYELDGEEGFVSVDSNGIVQEYKETKDTAEEDIVSISEAIADPDVKVTVNQGGFDWEG